jgi:hypothetical protein
MAMEMTDTIMLDDELIDPAEVAAELTAELERCYRWADHQDSCGDPRPDGDWSSLSATHGGTWSP